MPFGNGTGPQGMGPMTGRGAGYCSGFNQPGFANPTLFGRRFAAGVNWVRPRRFFPATWSGAARPYGSFNAPYFGRGLRRWWR